MTYNLTLSLGFDTISSWSVTERKEEKMHDLYAFLALTTWIAWIAAFAFIEGSKVTFFGLRIKSRLGRAVIGPVVIMIIGAIFSAPLIFFLLWLVTRVADCRWLFALKPKQWSPPTYYWLGDFLVVLISTIQSRDIIQAYRGLIQNGGVLMINLWDLGWWFGASGGLILVGLIVAYVRDKTSMEKRSFRWMYYLALFVLGLAAAMWILAVPLNQWPPFF